MRRAKVAKVKDRPDLIKRDGAVINTSSADYMKAKIRSQNANRLNRLESEVVCLSDKMDTIIKLLGGKVGL